MEEAEDAVRYQLGSGSARVPDLPQYIISKLGLNKNLIIDQENIELNELERGDTTESFLQQSSEKQMKDESIGMQIAKNAPKEEDFESIRVSILIKIY